MSVICDHGKCTGCRNLDEPRCVRNCPGDLMALDPATGKAYNRDPRDCWDCMACVKLCPHGALETKLPYALADYGAALRPQVKEDRIIWTCKDSSGRVEEYVIRTREF
jgi:adenylylsulfate reductase subunit B